MARTPSPSPGTSTDPTTAAAARAQLVTREFTGLQGYRMLPWAPVLLLFWGSQAGVLQGAWWMWAFGASVVAAIVGQWWVGRWYDRTYGRIRRHRRGQDVTRMVAITALVLVVAYGAIWAAIVAGAWPLDPDEVAVSWIGAVVGVAWAIGGHRLRPLTASSWWFGVVLAVVSLAPLGRLEVLGDQHPLNADGALLGVLTAFVLVVGIASHRALDRSLPGTGATTYPQDAGGSDAR